MPVIARFTARVAAAYPRAFNWNAPCALPNAVCTVVLPPNINPGFIISNVAIAIAARILPPPDLEPAAIGVIIISPSRRGNKHSKGLSSSCPPTSI